MGLQTPRFPSSALLRSASLGLLVAASAQAGASVTNPTIGRLLWSDEFNGSSLNTSIWRTYDGNGCQINLCGYGNAELEYYSPNNLSIADVPFEPGTRALAIRAQRQTVGSNQFTSGKVDTYGKVQIQYGMIEVRMASPSVATGLWPAAWLLGTSPQTWPRNGEIDMMEQGHRASAWSAAGAPSPDYYVGANVITWAQAACVPGNESCAASTAWQTKNWYKPQASLANRFVKYRLYWTESQMRFTVVDNDGEHDMYNAPLPVTSTSLQAPFYMLLNLAVGGNFTDAANPSQVTAQLPATMYVDYVRVYQLDGKGEVKLGSQITPEVGKFGVFTDNTTVNNKLVAGTSSDIFLWNTASSGAGNIAPFEGSNVIAWSYNAPGQWFGGGIQSRQIRDLSNFRNGTVKFRIKIPADVSFNIGIGDTYTNQSWVNFPAGTTTFGLVRNGDWGTATIPVSTLIGPKIALQSVADIFMISSDANRLPTSQFQFAIDDVVWDSGTSTQEPPTQPAPAGISQPTATSVKFSEPTGTWADVHYTVNGGGQLNVRMSKEGSGNAYTVSGLKKGDVVRYNFTYWDPSRNAAYDTAQQSYTLK
ncbi:glycoside hydrolase family 16 protein [Roseateles depolymerans]|uniref:Glycoside hydrolase n=1 Tax=Roseateles depolymerans TaxID=76731 RepID=A0A0U3E3G0_9BURK|nr:glycoside hydrolase family 16 protein [Roseateles depolymerans]ALV07733.1 Glycoside hydrolase [Roseateles depolymerans]REG22043.1 beta-glucanase (GH16 family) [Roseateles depolymerans]